jgi:hypothetical protein
MNSLTNGIGASLLYAYSRFYFQATKSRLCGWAKGGGSIPSGVQLVMVFQTSYWGFGEALSG